MDVEVLYEARFDVTMSLCRLCVRRYLKRTVGWGLWIVGAATLLIISAESLLNKLGFEWLGWAALGVVGVYLLTLVMLYWIMMFQTKQRVMKMEAPEVWIGASQEGLSLKSSEGESILKWRLFPKLWRFPDVWLLFQNSSNYIMLPVEQMGSEMRIFIGKRVEEAGGVVD